MMVTGLNLVMIAWAFGGVDVWSQLLAAGLSLLALVITLWPGARYTTSRNGAAQGAAWSMLRRFPIFWAGLALFGYVLIQHLNPAFAYQHSGGEWWLETLPHFSWLPAGHEGSVRRRGPTACTSSLVLPVGAHLCAVDRPHPPFRRPGPC